jgi:hypothetical protein
VNPYSPHAPGPDAEFIVADTNIVSFVFKADSRAGLYLPYLLARTPVLPDLRVITEQAL